MRVKLDLNLIQNCENLQVKIEIKIVTNLHNIILKFFKLYVHKLVKTLLNSQAE